MDQLRSGEKPSIRYTGRADEAKQPAVLIHIPKDYL